MMKIQIISKETIKPSSPTPQRLKMFKLSLLDQLIPCPYAPIIVFYPNNDGAYHFHQVQERLVLLKQSLSETLTRFYPLAGIIQDDLSIDCNDEGAYFAVARVDSHLSDFLKGPDLQVMHDDFLPCEPTFYGSRAWVTNIQVTIFKCGGMAIGLCISHKILDGAALSTFLKGWAATACGSHKVIYPDFIGSSLFPTKEQWLRDSSMVMWGSFFKKGKCTTRRLVFDDTAITKLKVQASDSSIQNPTRVEVVTAFIWKCAMAAAEKKHGYQRHSLLTHIVNLRKRTAPTLSEYSLGNIIWIAFAKCKEKYNELGFHGLVDLIRNGISNINGDLVKKIRGDEGCGVIRKYLKEMGAFGSKEEVDNYGFTSWCKLGFYEADFGWGKPVWVSSVGLNGSPFLNLIVLMDTRRGQGIEACLTLDEQEMNILEHDLDLLALASLDPSPAGN